MMNSPTRPETLSSRRLDFRRWQFRSGLGLGLGVTLFVGLPLTIIFDNPWWLVWSGFTSLLFGGVVMAALVGTGNLLGGVMSALLYFATVAVIYLVGQAAELWLPPWPRLPHHASAYFFLWPPALVLAGTLRLLVDGLPRKFGQDRTLVCRHLIPIFTAFSVIALATFRPSPQAISQPVTPGKRLQLTQPVADWEATTYARY